MDLAGVPVAAKPLSTSSSSSSSSADLATARSAERPPLLPRPAVLVLRSVLVVLPPPLPLLLPNLNPALSKSGRLLSPVEGDGSSSDEGRDADSDDDVAVERVATESLSEPPTIAMALSPVALLEGGCRRRSRRP
jgi:hypothetical protein